MQMMTAYDAYATIEPKYMTIWNHAKSFPQQASQDKRTVSSARASYVSMHHRHAPVCHASFKFLHDHKDLATIVCYEHSAGRPGAVLDKFATCSLQSSAGT
jgi:hypothetical protein